MSNVNGKAYAMNLVTPVYVKTSWLLLFIVPGIFIIFKSISHLLSFYNIVLIHGWLWGIVFLLAGVVFLLAGLARWLGMINTLSENILWAISFVFIGLALITSLSLFSAILFIVLGLALLVAGLLLLRNGVAWLNRFIFWLAGLPIFQKAAFDGLITLSLIHYARWVILRDSDFPRVSDDQPEEKLKYGYMFFFSNFNGSWTQYVDSFSVAIPGGLNLLWNKNLGWKNARVETPFNGYVMHNQIDTEYYYNAYPLASSNDVKSAKNVKREVLSLADKVTNLSAEEFEKEFDQTLLNLQADLSRMEPTPIVSLANEAIVRRESIQEFKKRKSKNQSK